MIYTQMYVQCSTSRARHCDSGGPGSSKTRLRLQRRGQMERLRLKVKIGREEQGDSLMATQTMTLDIR
jgi:hypothetical protein